MGDPSRGADRAGAPIAAVQEAAVEHALTVGDARRALALAGALDPLCGESTEDPALAALSTALVAWVGLRERDPGFLAGPPSPPGPGPLPDRSGVSVAESGDGTGDCDGVEPDDGDGAEDGDGTEGSDRVGRATPDPAAVGAAVAVARFDVSVARAASLAGRPRRAVERALADRGGNDPPGAC